MINAIGQALQGLLRAEERMAQSAEKVAKGDISAEALVDTKLAANDVRAQAKNLALQAKLEDEILDILA